MAIDNNVNLQQLSNQSQKNDILTKPQKYQVNPNAVDKTPDKDTVQLSSGLTTKEKVGIGAAIATGITLITFAVLGRNGHLGEGIRKFLGGKAKKAAQEMGEHTHTPNAHVEPKAPAEQKPSVKAEQEAKAKAEQEAKAKAEQEAKAKAEQEAKAKAEQEAKAKAEQEAKAKAEQEAKAKAEQEAKAKAEQEAKAKAEQEAKAKAEQEAKAKAEQEAKAKAEQEAKAKAEQEAKVKIERDIRVAAAHSKAADEIINKFDDVELEKLRKVLEDCEHVQYEKELIRHATSGKFAESIKTNGYDILHSSSNNGSNNFGGMDVEVPNSIADFGTRYGDTKLEYEFTGKAIKFTNEQSEKFDNALTNSTTRDGQGIIGNLLDVCTQNSDLSMGNLRTALSRNLLRKFGYDAIAVAPEQNKTLFITILDPNNTKGLKYLRTVPA